MVVGAKFIPPNELQYAVKLKDSSVQMFSSQQLKLVRPELLENFLVKRLQFPLSMRVDQSNGDFETKTAIFVDQDLPESIIGNMKIFTCTQFSLKKILYLFFF